MDKRTLVAFLLCGILTFIWIARMQSRQRERMRTAPQAGQEDVERPAPTDATGEQAPPVDPATPPSPSPELVTAGQRPAAPVLLRDEITFQGSDLRYDAVWTNRGACLSELRLNDYPQELGSDEGFLLIAGSEDDSPRTLALVDPDGALPFDTASYEVEESAEKIKFTSRFDGGLRVTKEFFPRPGKHEIGVRITFKNEGESEQWARYRIIAAGRVLPEGGSRSYLKGLIGYSQASGRVSMDARTARKQGRILKGLPYERTGNEEEPISWVGATNRYFAAVLQPVAPEGETSVSTVEGELLTLVERSDSLKSSSGRINWVNNVIASLTAQPKQLKPEEFVTHEYTYFVGPKKKDVLADYPAMAPILDYGWFGAVSKVLLVILRFFHRLIPNYGVGIILLTLVVKLCLHPLTRKGQLSMQKMQKLQPLIKELQEKYKNDRQRLGKEQMELFRKHGANPMSGCMPMFFQLPVFIGLFRMLDYSIAIRQEGFIWWITDLSRPDTIAVLGGRYPIRVLPVLMVISWVAQQLTMPKSPDPQQAQQQKMMLIMPIFFGFMLYGMASGLTLYWLTSTGLGIIEQKLIRMQIRKMEQRGELPDVVVEPVQKKSRRPKAKRR